MNDLDSAIPTPLDWATLRRQALIHYENEVARTTYRELQGALQQAVTAALNDYTKTLLQYICAAALKETGFTHRAVSAATNYNHSSVTHQMKVFYETIIDNPQIPTYTSAYAQTNCRITKPQLLDCYEKSKHFAKQRTQHHFNQSVGDPNFTIIKK